MILQEYIANVSSVTIIYIYILGNMILQEYISNVSSVTIIYIY